jgi:hypothetical protein
MIHSRYAVGVDASIRPYNAVCRIISAFRRFAHIHPALGVAHSFQFRQPLLSRYFFAFSSDIIRPSILQKNTFPVPIISPFAADEKQAAEKIR